MPKPSTLWVIPVIAALAGCGVAAKVNARHDMESSKVAYKGCLAEHGQDAAACDGLRQAYEADLSAYRAIPKIVIGAGNRAPLPTSDGMGTGLGTSMAAGQTVYSPHECIGAVVMGQCHGSILPDYSRPHPTCYGQLLNGICTGPMF
jgi:hypothetical protein